MPIKKIKARQSREVIKVCCGAELTVLCVTPVTLEIVVDDVVLLFKSVNNLDDFKGSEGFSGCGNSES